MIQRMPTLQKSLFLEAISHRQGTHRMPDAMETLPSAMVALPWMTKIFIRTTINCQALLGKCLCHCSSKKDRTGNFWG
jgi:hypothetical protein